MTDWHLSYKQVCKPEYIEVKIDKYDQFHITDIMTSDGIVIQLQYSSISDDKIYEREQFYDDMIWLFNCLPIRNKNNMIRYKGEIIFDSKNIALIKLYRKIKHTSKPTFYDSGDIVYEYIGLSTRKNNTGRKIWCCKHDKHDFIHKYLKSNKSYKLKYETSGLMTHEDCCGVNVNLDVYDDNTIIVASRYTYNIKDDLKTQFMWINRQ